MSGTKGNFMKRFARLGMGFVAAVTVSIWTPGNTLAADWITEINGADPLNWYKFDERSGTVANDFGSGNMNGTYMGNVVLGSQGLTGGAAEFAGGSYVFLGGANLTGDWSVEAIFKADTVAGGVSMGLVGTDFAAASGRMALKAEQWESTGQMGYTLFGVADVTFSAPAAVTPADFAHVVFVAQNSGVSLYVNGALAGTDATVSPLSRWVLGAGARNADESLVDPLTGAIDELVIYNRALSTAEIATHFTAIPEPGVWSILALGGLLVWRFRSRAQ
jgi:hypothetical protein